MFTIQEVCPAARSRMQRTVYKNNYRTIVDLHEGSKRVLRFKFLRQSYSAITYARSLPYILRIPTNVDWLAFTVSNVAA